MSSALHQGRPERGVYVYDLLDAPWSPTGKAGIRQKVIRADIERGEFLGIVEFEAMTAPGLHKHTAPATSLMLKGSMDDFQGSYGEGAIAINPTGATHDAMSWGGALFVARLEGAVLYPTETALEAGHTGAIGGDIVNDAPEVLPAIDFHIHSVRPSITSCHRVSRRMLFDYAIEKENRRFVEMLMMPGAAAPAHTVNDRTEWMVMAGDVWVNNTKAVSGSMVILEPGTEVSLRSEFGCRFLAWAQAPMTWSDGSVRPDMYGF